MCADVSCHIQRGNEKSEGDFGMVDHAPFCRLFVIAVHDCLHHTQYDPGLLGFLRILKEYLFTGKGTLTTTGLEAHIFTQSKVAKRSGLKGNDLVWAPSNTFGTPVECRIMPLECDHVNQ